MWYTIFSLFDKKLKKIMRYFLQNRLGNRRVILSNIWCFFCYLIFTSIQVHCLLKAYLLFLAIFFSLEISLSRWGRSTRSYFASINPRSERPRACSRVREELVSNRECPWICLTVAHFSFEGRIDTDCGFGPQIRENIQHEALGKLILSYKQTSCFLKGILVDWLSCVEFLRLSVV